MGIDENKLYEAFRREADIPPELQQRLGRTYEQLRQLSQPERENPTPHKTTRRWIKTLLVAAAIMSLLTVTAFSVGVHTGFIKSAFGTGVSSREGYERVDVDPDLAENLIGEYIAQVGTVVELGDFTFTIDSAVMDQNGLACIRYTVENPNGLEAKDVYYAERGEFPPYTLVYETEQGQVLSDETLEDETLRSETRRTFVAYITPFAPVAADEGLVMVITLWLDAETAGPAAQVSIPAEAKVGALAFTGGNLCASVSPIGIEIGMPDAEAILPQEGAQADPASPVPTPDISYNLKINELRIVYTDGSEYVVIDGGSYNASKGSAHDKTLRFVFNRLVDTDSIETLVINGVQLSK